MVQYHPTTLAGQRAADHRGRPRRGRVAAERRGRAVHGAATRPTSSSSPRATWSREPSRPRSTRAAASRTAPSRSTSPRSRAAARSRRCGRSSTSAATSPASTSPASRSTSGPGMHYIMGGVKTDIDGRTDDPRAVRGRRGRLRVGPRRQPPGRQLAARHADLRPALGRARRASRRCRCRCPRPRRRASADAEQEIDAIINREPGGRRIGAIKHELGATMNEYVAVFRDARGAREGARDRAAASRRRQRRRRSTTAARSSTRT